MQRIIVKNFGPLKDIDLEIKDFMVIIGPNASGKSTLTKLIYFFRNFSTEIVKAVGNSRNQGEVDHLLQISFKNKLVDFFGDISDYGISSKTSVRFYYESKNSFFRDFGFFFEDGKFKFLESSQNLFEEFQEYLNQTFEKEIPPLKEFLRNDINLDDFLSPRNFNLIIPLILENFKIENFTNSIYIPAGRSIIAKNYTPNSSDTILWEFYQTVRKVKDRLKTDGFFSDSKTSDLLESLESKIALELDSLFIKILKGKYINEHLEDKIQLNNGTYVNLSNTSSGQQEIIWVLNILYYLIINKERSSIILEEPEANLFPESQSDVLKALALYFNNGDSNLIVNTHSHYLISELNVLINAYRLGQIHPDEVNKVIPKAFWLNRENVFVGYLKDGKIKDIYDEEAEMYEIEELTHVASILNEEFDKLDQIEFADADTN